MTDKTQAMGEPFDPEKIDAAIRYLVHMATTSAKSDTRHLMAAKLLLDLQAKLAEAQRQRDEAMEALRVAKTIIGDMIEHLEVGCCIQGEYRQAVEARDRAANFLSRLGDTPAGDAGERE